MRSTSPIAALFGKSPFQPLQAHMKVARRAADELIPLFEGVLARDEAAIKTSRDLIFQLEREADALKKELRSHLPRSLFMPVDRRDLLNLLGAQDSIADAAQDIASLLTLRPVEMPAFLGDRVLPFARQVIATVDRAAAVVNELDDLLESGFRGAESERVEAMIGEISALETATDETGLALVSAMFDHEHELSALRVIFWQKVFRTLGRVADHAENVGDRLRLLIAR
jgi:predicted phosphate transport protein (TIGR00153 family)